MMGPKYGFTAQQIIEEGRITEDDINILKIWLETQNFPKLSDEQIVLFLLSNHNNQEGTQSTIKAYYTCRYKFPQGFDDRKMQRADLQKQLKTVEFCVFPERTDKGYIVLFHSLHDTVYSNYDMIPSMKLMSMTLDAAMYDNPPNGLVVVFDMKGVGLMHMTRINMAAVKAFLQYSQEGLPVRLKSIHIMNTVYFVDKLIAIAKPFLNKRVARMLNFHSSDVNLETFYEKCIPKRCMPIDFGGDLPSVRVMHQENIAKLTAMEWFFDAEENQRHSHLKSGN